MVIRAGFSLAIRSSFPEPRVEAEAGEAVPLWPLPLCGQSKGAGTSYVAFLPARLSLRCQNMCSELEGAPAALRRRPLPRFRAL